MRAEYEVPVGWILATLLIVIVVSGCESDTPILTQGSLKYRPSSPQTLVVWGDSGEAVSAAAMYLQQMGYRVVERQKVRRLFGEQRFHSLHTSDREADVLRIGRMVEADQVVFVEYDYREGGSASVRGVSVSTGEVLWTGQAQGGWLNPPPARVLTTWAMDRVWCPPEMWKEQRGCRTP